MAEDRGFFKSGWRLITNPALYLFFIWYLFAAVVVFEVFQRAFPTVRSIPQFPRGLEDLRRLDVDDWQRLFLLLCVALFFPFIHAAICWSTRLFRAPIARTSAAAEEGAFPSPGTLLVALLLLLIIGVNLVGLFLALHPPRWPGAPGILVVTDKKLAQQIHEALVTLFAAGIGSSIATIQAFNRHASWLKDFQRSWISWYIARPVMGMLLGLIFYFLIRGGLLAVSGSGADSNADLNEWGLAGIGALVGLFSRNAISKLSEVFRTMFRTEDELRARLALLSGDVRDKLAEALPESIRRTLFFGTGDELKAALRALSPSQKDKLRKDLPDAVRPIIETYLIHTEADRLIETLKGLKKDDRKKLLELPKLKDADATELLISENGGRLVELLKTVEESELKEKGLTEAGLEALDGFVKSEGEVLLEVLGQLKPPDIAALEQVEHLSGVVALFDARKGDELIELFKGVEPDKIADEKVRALLTRFLKPPAAQ